MNNKGFTLIELIIVVAIMLVGFGVVVSFVGGSGTVADSLNGVRCIAGYKVLVGPYSKEQLRDVDNRPIPCR